MVLRLKVNVYFIRIGLDFLTSSFVLSASQCSETIVYIAPLFCSSA